MERPHHLVIFVREDMAVPDVATGFIESHLDAGNFTRYCHDYVAPRLLGRIRTARAPHGLDLFQPETDTLFAVVLQRGLLYQVRLRISGG